VPTGRWVRKRRSSLRCFVESCLAIGDGLANECDCIWVQTVPRTRDRLTCGQSDSVKRIRYVGRSHVDWMFDVLNFALRSARAALVINQRRFPGRLRLHLVHVLSSLIQRNAVN
jgi:hypothetical protein